MAGLTWLHLSDWHQKGPDFDRKVVADALINDIRERAKRIDGSLEQVDFVVFSGDAAFYGKPEEFLAARHKLFDPVLAALGLPPERLFMVPGNHDLDRLSFKYLPEALKSPFKSRDELKEWMEDLEGRGHILRPFKSYREFATSYIGQSSPDYASIGFLACDSKQVALLGLNSAWMCARNKETSGEVNDYGYVLVGEPQIHDALAQIQDAEVKIAVLHHPFDWIPRYDRSHVEDRLGRACHFILHGHVHTPKVQHLRGTEGDRVIIPAGASFDRRKAEAPGYTNAYNFVHLDFDSGSGVVYLRRWSDPRTEWAEDTDTYPGGNFVLDSLPKGLGAIRSSKSTSSAAPLTPAPTPRYERERRVLEGYLNALVSNNSDLDPHGIKTSKEQVVVPLEEIYVGLQADRDRPDVDRRVLQEELDEVKKRLELEEDREVRERQYQIWANQTRVIQQALEIVGPREELSGIVQRCRQVVILGDPGSGKTTLVRYLTLRFARAILAEPDRLFRSQDDIWDGKAIWRLPDLGPVRLPIFLRISHYAEARQRDPDLSLTDYLPRYFAGLQVPYADELGSILRQLLEAGRCIVLLDGLDEIIDPADRHNIATAIGQFVGVYREMGLPNWLARSLAASTPEFMADKPQANVDANEDDVSIQWDKNIPEDVRQEWSKQIKQNLKEWRRDSKASQLAWRLLGGARYAHFGNRFVVTSRIAGYHFAGVPGEFEHYTIRRMSLEDITLFLEKWCPAVERRIAKTPDPAQVEQRARREIDGILKSVRTTAGVRRMAENPLLLRILATIHRNEAHLPQRRVELYETATVTLLRDWHLGRGTKDAAIDDVKAMSLLGPVAFEIHENRASGFLSKGETERFLARILAKERGEDPEQPSLATHEAVQQFLETIREHSGLFVERGEGLYGFMHLTFEEYFTARHLVSSSARARTQIQERLHLPRWREPILLAIGSLSKQFYDDTHDLLTAILDAGSPYERVLHRDLLFTAACVGDSVNVALQLRQRIAERLLSIYCDRRRTGRYRLLQRQVKEALLTLCNDQGDVAVEAALAETLTVCADRSALTCALEAVDWLKARTPDVANALAACTDPSVMPQAQGLLRAVQARLPVNGNGKASAPAGWDSVRDDADLARLLGAIVRYGENVRIAQLLGGAVPDSEILNHPLSVGMEVILGQHRPVSGEDNWNDAMTPFVGQHAHVTELRDQDSEQCLGVKVDIDDSRWFWRVRDLRVVMPDGQEISGETYAERDPNWLQRIEAFGWRVLASAKNLGTLAPMFADRSACLIPLQPRPHDDALRANVQAIQADLVGASLDLLRRTIDPQPYSDAAYFLVHTGEARPCDEAIAIILADLEGDNAVRRRLALRLLSEGSFREHIQFTESRRALLLGLLDAPVDQATLALDILFDLSLTPDLLAWCWSVLRHADHLLADAVIEKLDAVQEIRANGPLLALLDEGLSDAALKRISLRLLRKVSWQGTETFVQALIWLSNQDAEVRHLAALLLAGQEALLAVPLAVGVKASLNLLKVVGSDIQQRAPFTIRNWDTLRDDPHLVRLFGGLWLNGWDEALTQLWVAQPAVSYVDEKHPRKYWRSFCTYPENEECICWLLEEAESGQTLIPTFQKAAARLAELKDDTQGAPLVENIAVVQGQILQQMETLMAQPDTPPLLRAEAGILVAAARREPVSPVSAITLQAAMEGSDNWDWFDAMTRLAGRSDQLPKAVKALSQALTSTDPERRLSCLSILTKSETLRTMLAERLTARYFGQPVDVNEALLALCVLLQINPSPVGLYPWLQSLFTGENELPLAVWLRQTLSSHDLTPDASPASLVGLLTVEYASARLAASLALLAADLPALLVPVLVDATRSQNDLVRLKGIQQLYWFCYRRLPTDSSTQAIEWLQCAYQASEGKGREGTVTHAAITLLDYQSTYWPIKWIQGVRNGNELEERFARQALGAIHRASQAVIRSLCELVSGEQPTRVREAAVRSLLETLQGNQESRADATIQSALITALNDIDTDIRRAAAYALQWSVGQGAWTAARSLLHSSQSDPDSEMRVLALRSAGRVLHFVRGLRDVDVSKEALFRWFETQRKERTRFERDDVSEVVKQLPDLAVLREASDTGAVLNAMAHPDDLGLPDETAARLRDAEDWRKLLESARQEWQFRHYWQETSPNLQSAITQVENLLDAPESAVRRAAACALSRMYHGENDRPARLLGLLHDNAAVLQALLDAITDRDNWMDEDTSLVSHHPWAVKQIASWLEARPPDERARFVAKLLDDLESTMIEMETEDIEIYDVIGDEQWCPRRALVAVLAELSERLTYRAFTSQRDLADVVAIFSRAAADPGSYNARRFAIRTLGNLQQLTSQVADVFFTACQDIREVYRETRLAVSKFKIFGPGSLERLTAAITSPSITVAYHAALLLGELGVSRSDDLGREGRKRVADELVCLLDDPLSERIVYDFTKDSDGERVGPLYDVIYEALTRVVAGPDAQRFDTAPETSEAPTAPPSPSPVQRASEKSSTPEDPLAALERILQEAKMKVGS